MSVLRVVSRAIAGVAVLAGTGCPAPNTYQTARTLAPGHVQLLASADSYGATTTDGDGVVALPPWPSIGARVGVLDGVDIGARLPSLASVAGDVKVRLLKGTVDLALDPGLQWFQWNLSVTDDDSTLERYRGNVFYMQLPVIIDYNLSRQVSLVASPGATYVFGTGSSSIAGSWFGQLGLGVDVRVTRWLSIMPEVTLLSDFQSDGLLTFMSGIGFAFWGQPSFDDIGGPMPR